MMARFGSNLLRGVFLVSLVWGGFGDGVAADPGGPDDSVRRPSISGVVGIPAAVHDAMQARRYQDAVKAIESELQNDAVTAADYLLYLKALALSHADQRDDAVAAYLELEKRFPKSEWVSRSRFGRAAVAVMNRQYNVAGEIYQREAERLLSRGRKDELAKIYLEFADRFFEGVPANDPSRAKQPDYKQALEYYREANKLGPTIRRRQQIEFRVARCIEELKQLDQATQAYQAFLARHGDPDPNSGVSASVELQSDAMYRLGVVQLENKQPSAARRTWQDLLSKHDPPLDPSESLADRLANATYRLAHTYGLPNPATDGNLELAVTLAERFLKAYPDHPLAAKAELEIAQGYESRRRNVQAIDRLESLIANPIYRESDQLAIARRMLGQSYFAQNEFDKAIEAWKEFLENHPTDSQWPDVQQKIIGAEFAAAQYALNEKDFAKARALWQTFLNKYPLDQRAPNILLQFGEMNRRDALDRHQQRVDAAIKKGRSGTEIRLNQTCRELLEDAIADWQRLVDKYPDTAQASLASLRIGITLEEQLQRREEALQSYKKVKGASESAAKQRIARLTRPELQVMTKRKFRSDEQAGILLTTRNLEKVSVAVYTIDMTDYFRKMHLATGVEKLDIALIDPDQQFEHAVDDYEPFKQIEQEVTIPVDGPGVTAVTVSSDKMEATTMVVVSDLDILVKSSRNELFLFAQNMRTGKPAEGVSVLVSDGASVFEELVTDAEGIVRSQSKRLRDIKDLRVFAVHQGQIASTVTNLNGLDFAVGLVPTGYLFTDRPVYRPGELVNIKGIVRWVDQDRFTFRKGERFVLDVYDARGRNLKTETVTLNAFGSLHTNMVLPSSAVPGRCRIHLHRRSTPNQPELSFESQFEVKQFKLEPVQLTIQTDQDVYFRGDEITATVSLEYYYGAPLPGEEISYSIGGESERETAKTDADGKVELKFPTRRFSESQAIAIDVACPQRNVRQSQTVFLATRGFNVNVTTGRSVYIAGETFDVNINVVDPADKPVGTAVRLEVFEVTRPDGASGTGSRLTTRRIGSGRTGERRIEVFDVTTDAEEGQAGKTIQIERGGTYIVRATGKDRFGNSVSGQTRLQISGDDDTTRLRILADQHNYRVGDNAGVRLHWRDAPALALVTFDGASVLGHRLVQLKQGENKIDIPIDADLAPNFYLSASVMQRSKLHHAVSGFVVAKRLQVKLTPSTTDLKPTDRVKVGIEVTDSSGRPVAAELAMSLVQSNLLDRFGADGQKIVAAFTSGLRQRRIRQTSSCEFSYSTQTRSINEALLVESERRSRRLAEADAAANVFADGEVSLKFAEIAGDVITEDEPFGANQAEDFAYSGDVSSWQSLGVHFDVDNDALVQRMQSQIRMQQQSTGGTTATRRATSMYAQTGPLSGNRGVQAGQLGDRQWAQDWSFWGAKAPASISKLGRVDSKSLQRRDVTINGLTLDGKLLVINGMSDDEVNQLNQLTGVRMFGQAISGETGFWDPVIVTDPDGKAEIEITMPADSTAWKLSASAISTDTLAGSQSVDLVTRKSLFGQLRVPQAFTVGDKADVRIEVHNSLEGPRTINVALKAAMGSRSLEQNKTLEVKDAGIETLTFPVEIAESDQVQFELTIRSEGVAGDTDVSTAEVLPYGFPVYQTASGVASQNTLALIQLEPNQKTRGQSLELMIGGDRQQSLLDSLVRAETYLPLRCFPTSLLDRSASDCLGGVAVLNHLRRSAQPDSPEGAQVSGIIAGAVSHLIASQRDDGGWSLAGHSAGPADPISTARAMGALVHARRAGFAVPERQFELGVASLKKAFAGATDLNRQAVLLAALAECGAGDFALANRLYRERNRLDDYGVVQLMLALTSLNHNEMAAELVSLVNLDRAGGRSSVGRTSVEIAALELIALQRMNLRPELRAKLAERLMAARAGSRWPVESDNGPAIAALSAHFGENPPQRERVALTIYVNGEELESLTLEPGAESRRIQVPDELLVDDRQRIEFELDGRGEFSYSAVLTGFSDADSITSTTTDWSVGRRYEPDQMRVDGRPIPRGYRVIDGSHSWSPNKLTELPVGERALVTLTPRVRYQNSRPLRTYLMLVEPIPAGCTILEETISGVFDRYDITPGAITFYIGDAKTPGDIRYTLAGYLPGNYRTAPAVLKSYYSPSEIAVTKPGTLRVLSRGETSGDEYKLTPDELFELGKVHFAKGEFQKAYDSLRELHENWQLHSDPYKETVLLLFRASIKLGSHADIVRFFEIVKERFPEVELSFEEILTVAMSYREIAEYERSYLVYRATVQASFEKENQVAGFLNARGEFLRSVQAMESLLRDYPAESYVATASYALAQEVYRRAETVAEDKTLMESGITRVDLIASSIRMLDDFVTNWPEDPSSDQASFALATALIDLEQYERAIRRGRQYAQRYPDSRLLDSFWYMIGFCYFELQDHEQALQMCRKVAEATFTDPKTGASRQADNKWEAVYIMGQIHHSLGQAAKAIDQYAKVSDRFKDAAEAIEFFSRKSVSLPDVTTLLAKDESEVLLQHRNVSSVLIKVYRIDLMKFGLTQRNLDRITAINLAGIKPYHQETVELGDGKDYRDRETKIALPLKEQGAYLVVGRSDNLYTSGLMVVSPLALTVEEDSVSGRVRVSVKDKTKDAFVGDVHVKVIGSANDQFVSGQTDLRGLFVADGIEGTGTVIAVGQNDQYAFHRGSVFLQQARGQTLDRQRAQTDDMFGLPADASQEPAAGQSVKGGKALLNNLFNQNGVFQQEQKMNYEGLMNNRRDGVQSKEAY
ncbi:tol-pal system protein YbgF [Stieleria neptunia]|uniref:Tol-pal system protein YbgF n=1 Tax=Stieleria neptunia TaxID=2527979 RepID=A0A518HXH0_9BACT|nr:tetratricopeptide repeat protein [Stieleria neptunia]QDV45560.1 tol-pal system protein YbgF [Stieleria neptunia]